MARDFETVKCAKCGYEHHTFSVHMCPHPAVMRVYGAGYPAPICVYCCSRCQHSERIAHTGARRCTYANPT